MTIPFADRTWRNQYSYCADGNCSLCARYGRQCSRLALHVTTRSWYGV